jgi:hypothetical protein
VTGCSLSVNLRRVKEDGDEDYCCTYDFKCGDWTIFAVKWEVKHGLTSRAAKGMKISAASKKWLIKRALKQLEEVKAKEAPIFSQDC